MYGKPQILFFRTNSGEYCCLEYLRVNSVVRRWPQAKITFQSPCSGAAFSRLGSGIRFYKN